MSLPLHIVKDAGGTISIDLLTQPSTATVTIYTDRGTAIVSDGTATISSISTTLSASASKGATSISVAANTGFSAGGKFWINDVAEECLIKSISGTTVTLRRPLMFDHTSAAEVKGTRVSYTVSASQASSLFYDGRAMWAIDGVTAHVSAIECGKYPLNRLATLQDLFDENSKVQNMLPADYDVERNLDVAFEDILTAIAAKDRARALTASGRELARATVLCFYRNLYRSNPQEETERMYERYRLETTQEIEKIASILPADPNQDGVIEQGERINLRTIRLSRG